MNASEFYKYFQLVRRHATKREETASKTVYTDQFGNQAIEYKTPAPYNLGLFYNKKLYHIRPKNT